MILQHHILPEQPPLQRVPPWHPLSQTFFEPHVWAAARLSGCHCFAMRLYCFFNQAQRLVTHLVQVDGQSSTAAWLRRFFHSCARRFASWSNICTSFCCSPGPSDSLLARLVHVADCCIEVVVGHLARARCGPRPPTGYEERPPRTLPACQPRGYMLRQHISCRRSSDSAVHFLSSTDERNTFVSIDNPSSVASALSTCFRESCALLRKGGIRHLSDLPAFELTILVLESLVIRVVRRAVQILEGLVCVAQFKRGARADSHSECSRLIRCPPAT